MKNVITRKLGIPDYHVLGIVGDKTLVKVLTAAPIMKASAQM
jgi:hypothetical protein